MAGAGEGLRGNRIKRDDTENVQSDLSGAGAHRLIAVGPFDWWKLQ